MNARVYLLTSYNADGIHLAVTTNVPIIATVYAQCLKNAHGEAFAYGNHRVQAVPYKKNGFATVSCPPGYMLVGTGFASSNLTIVQALSITGSTSMWVAAHNNFANTDNYIEAKATCLAYLGAKVSVVGPAPSGAARCPSGSYVTGGGFVGSLYEEPWAMYAENNGMVVKTPSQKAKVYSLCLRFT